MLTPAPPRSQLPPYPPQPPVPPFTDPRLPEVHVSPPMVFVEPVFEYRTVTRELGAGKPPLSEAELNELGKAGWELVSVLGDGGGVHFYFKRLVR